MVILDDEVTPPTVSNGDGVTNVLWTTATLRGRIVDDGGLDCQGYFYWGASDGVTNEASWSNKVEMGSQFADFETEIEGMVAGRAYYYRCAAENNRGQSWAGSTLVFTTLQAQVSGGVNYYVNDSSTVGDLYCTAVGSDGNGGTTPGTPKATLQNLISTKALAAGDCVWVDTGIYNMSAPVTITSADDGSAVKKVTFRGATGNAGTVLDVNDPAKYVVYLFMANYVRLENLRFRKGQCGVFVYYCTGSDVVNCHSYSNSEHGVFAYFSGSGIIADNRCYRNQQSGIIIGASTGPFVISGNECYEQKENAGIAVQNTDITIINNACYDNAAEGILVETTSSTPVVLTNNECFYNTKAGIDVMCQNMEAVGNRLYYNGTYGIITDNTGQHTFRNNISYWNGSYSFYIQGSPIKALIRHNTVYGGNGIYINDPGRVTNDNNVVWAVGGGNRAVYMKYAPGGSDVCLSDYNNLYASGGAHAGRWDTNECATLDDWKTYSSRDAGSVSADPLFVNSGSGDMHLKSVAGSYHNGGWWGDEANSPSIDAGDPISGSFTNEPDYNGITLNQGAYGGTWQASRTYYTGPFYSIFLAVDPSGDDGWATVNPSQMLTVPTNSYPTNRAVLVEAGANDGRYYRWSHWAGDFSSTNNPGTFYVTGDMNVTAVLERVMYSIQTISGPNGTIDPTGTVSVAAGSNMTFSILADPTYQVSNVVVDAISIGRTNSYTFINVLTNHTIEATFEAERYQLTVSTEHGTALPIGTAWYDYGSNVNCRLSDSPVTNGLIRYECTGWKGTGSVAEGSGTNTVVTITNTSTLAWQWRTNFWLDVTAGTNGNVDTASGWQWAGTNASILAIPTNGYTFAGWTGDTNSMSNPLTLAMYRAYSVTANFEYGGSFIIATAHANGTIAPSGFVPVDNGADTNFVITANDHCYIVDVEVDGASIGVTNAYTFENVTTNHTIEAWFAMETRQLIVTSDHDKASPAGTNFYDYGTYITCSVTGTPVMAGDTRYDCTGREGTGSAPSGVGTNFGFNITNDSTVTWLWNTNYMLNVSLSGSGSVNVTNGWKTAGTNISVQANPGDGYHFASWTGDTNTSANPLNLTMNRGYAITGTFEINMYTITVSAVVNGSISPSGLVVVAHGVDTNFLIEANDGYIISNVVVDGSSVGTPDNYTFYDVTNNHTISAVFQLYAASAKGTPIWWLEKYGFTNNYDVADTNDQDIDGAFTWQEYLAGTVPTNRLSAFVIFDMGKQGGSNYVRWFGTTNSGVYTDFLMYRSTGLISGGWSLIESNLSRSGTGINEWWDDDPPGSKVFYRPALPPTNQ